MRHLSRQLLLVFICKSALSTFGVLADVSGDFDSSCTDARGERFSSGQAVPSSHPCRTCICGSKGNILCNSLNRITDCNPPTSSLCKNVDGNTCCERSFTCDRLKSCDYAGGHYQPGEITRHSNDQCQTCTCGFDGKVDCMPHSSCVVPQWINDLGATDCTPVYAGKNCCPVDYSCKCSVFNETLSRGPRNVARCKTCSCSKLGGMTPCKPMACKIPYKFSDKCKAIYRENECCPIDYDCGTPTKSTAKVIQHKPQQLISTQKPLVDADMYDVLPYATEAWETKKAVSAQSRSFPTENAEKVTKPENPVQKKLRIIPNVPTSPQLNTSNNEVTRLTINNNTPESQKVVVVVDGTLNGHFVTREPVPKSTIVEDLSTASTPDPLLKVFLKHAEFVSKIMAAKVTEAPTSLETTDYTPFDFLTTPLVPTYSVNVVRGMKGKNRMDSKLAPSRFHGGNPGGMYRNAAVESTSTTTTTEVPTVFVSSTLAPDQQTEKNDNWIDAGIVSTSTSDTSMRPPTTMRTSTTPDSLSTALLDAESTLDPETSTKTLTSTTKRLTSLWNSSRFNLDNPYSMSSSDAGFLADDLSYKMFSVNFFRSPVKDASTLTPVAGKNLLTPAPVLAWEALNFSDVGLVDSLGQQGQEDPIRTLNLTNLNGTSGVDELISDSAAEVNSTSTTISPDYQVVTFGSLPRNSRPKSAGQLLPPQLSPGMGGAGILPFTTEIEFKGFGIAPEIEFKPLKGLAEAAAMAGMLNGLGGGGGGGGTFNVGSQLLGSGGGNAAVRAGFGESGGGGGGGGNNAGTKLAAAVAAQDAMEELAEGGTGDGALALAAALMHNPHRPVPARLIESTHFGRITTPSPTVAVAFPNGSMQISAALRESPNPGSDPKKGAALEGASPNSRRVGEFNSFFPSQNHNFNFGGMGNPWSSPIFTGAGMGGGGTTPDPKATTAAFPFEMVADVIEEGRGPALTQLLGALQMMGGRQQQGMGGMPSFPMGPPPRGSMNSMNAMMNAMNNPMMNRNNFFGGFPQQSMSGGTGMEGMNMFGTGGLFNLFAGSLSALESTAPAAEPTLIAPASSTKTSSSSSSKSGQQTLVEPKRRTGPAYSLPGENGQQLRPMYKVSSGLTESPLVQPARASQLE